MTRKDLSRRAACSEDFLIAFVFTTPASVKPELSACQCQSQPE